jgi:hypothetical protein
MYFSRATSLQQEYKHSYKSFRGHIPECFWSFGLSDIVTRRPSVPQCLIKMYSGGHRSRVVDEN